MAKTEKKEGLSSILVAVSGEPSDENAVRLSCRLLNPQKSELHILYVIEVERALPLDAEVAPATAKGEEVLRHMEQVAQSYRHTIQAELLQSREAASAVVQEAVDRQVDAIVLGVPYKSAYGYFTMGTTAPYILKNAPCQVILWRDLIPGSSTGDGRNP